jgi:CheY-like chemotaxis protein
MIINRPRTRSASSHRTALMPQRASSSPGTALMPHRAPAPDEEFSPKIGRIVCEEYEPRTPEIKPVSHDQLDVLIVDDNRLSQVVAATLLDDLGCRYEFAATGVEGLHLAMGKRFDLILMDIMMPHMDGLEATRRIRREEQEHGGHQVSIIAMTILAMREDVEAYLDSGMDGFLFKPVDGQGLRRIIRYSQRRVARQRDTPRPLNTFED